MFESSEVFEAYAMIDYGYFLLKKINKQLGRKSPTEKMIDRATGFDKEQIKQGIEVMDLIIENKKKIEADHSKEVEFRGQLMELLTPHSDKSRQ